VAVPEQLYGIDWHPDAARGVCGPAVRLYPAWRAEVARARLTPDLIRAAARRLAPVWLKAFGFETDDPLAVRVAGGEWGPEHITVPGNACGLDLADGIGAPPGGKVLLPHNVDSVRQAGLLLGVFLWYAGCLEGAREGAFTYDSAGDLPD
jgi:hypothetical protein